jgi:hypothetical protein
MTLADITINYASFVAGDLDILLKYEKSVSVGGASVRPYSSKTTRMCFQRETFPKIQFHPYNVDISPT